MTAKNIDHELRMLARAALTVRRKFNVPSDNRSVVGAFVTVAIPNPTWDRSQSYLDFVRRQNWQIWNSEVERDDRIRFGFDD